MESQVRYLVSWFKEWSEMQKSDFLKILTGKFAPVQNGIVDAMEIMKVHDRPPSIFQCQIKLFNEWFDLWSEAERGALIEKFREVDANFVAKFEEELSGSFAPAAVAAAEEI